MSESDAGIADNAIAIIGMDGRFSGSDDIEHFWRKLRDGVECISFFTDDELKAAGVSDAELEDPAYVRARGVLNGYDRFDAGFFGYSPSEAEIMDPQHRVFLECGWSALEDAGYDPANYDGLIGVYAGTSVNSYFINNLYPLRGTGKLFAIDKDFVSTRLSYKLNLKGPSLSVQTACSTSLVAICEACQSLLDYRCDMALSGGVSITTPAVSGYRYQEGSISSRDGHCRAFDADASGTISGAGAGVVVLKRLSDAIDDGDSIRAVIRGFSVNNDGSDKVGYSAPSVSGQAEVVAMALALAELEANAISYVECHGTGTTLGDPIEITALSRAFRETSDRTGTCAIGSVKTNIGHLDAAAGVAGLIKTVLALQHRKLPPSLNYRAPNPKIDFEQSPFFVNTELRDWQTTDGEPRRAGVSSFGIGGTNAHVVVEEAPQQPDSAEQEGYQLLPLSARSEAALDAVIANLAAHLREHPQQRLADIAWTLQAGRHVFDHRRVLVCRDREDAVSVLEQTNGGRILSANGEVRERRCVFMFSGQGSQYPNMALDLYRDLPEFRENLQQCARLLAPHLGLDLLELLYPGEEDADGAAARLTETRYAQPALFAVEYALAELWMRWGIEPAAMIGHSIGEYVAACIAGVFTLEDALRVVAERGRLMHDQPEGVMLSVPLPAETIQPTLPAGLTVAVINAPSMCVVAGESKLIDEFESRLTAEGQSPTRLHTSHAFHSAMMQPAADALEAFLQTVPMSPPTIPVISNVSGDWLDDRSATDPAYWARHLRSTVRFSDGVERLLGDADRWFLELGPSNTLAGLVRLQSGCGADTTVLPTLRHPREAVDDHSFLLGALGRAWLAGIRPDWNAVRGDAEVRRVPLPTYPFQRQRYWIETNSLLNAAIVDRAYTADDASGMDPSKDPDIHRWCYVPVWRSVPPLPPREDRREAVAATRWLLFLDGEGVGEALDERIRCDTNDIVRVYSGDGFELHGNGDYSIDPDNGDDYRRLFESVMSGVGVAYRLIHFWAASQSEGTQQELQRSLKSVIHIARALGDLGETGDTSIHVVVDGVQAVTGDEIMHPAKSPVTALLKVISLELPGIECQSIDIDAGEDQQAPGWILRECLTFNIEPVVAYRHGRRWLPSYERLNGWQEDALPSRLHEGGTYLITGGLGGIGLALAEHLATRYRARLVLTGRSAMPAREQWDDWLTGNEQSAPTAVRIRKLMALEAEGAELMVARADASDREQMQAVVEQAEQRFGTIRGVVHAAGIVRGPSFGPLSRLQPDACDEQFRPKILGVQVLDEIFSERAPDFILVMSSLASVLGGLGMACYAAANQYMDSFVAERHSMGCSYWQSINWDAWRLQSEPEQEPAKTGLAALAMDPGEALAVFDRIMRMEAIPQLVISTSDLVARMRMWHKPGMERKSAKSVQTISASHERPPLGVEFVAARTDTEKTVAGIWQEMFNIGELGIHDNFFELGGHSLMAIQLVSRFREQLHVDIAIERFLELATIEAVSAYVDVKLHTGNKHGMGYPEDDACERDEFDI